MFGFSRHEEKPHIAQRLFQRIIENAAHRRPPDIRIYRLDVAHDVQAKRLVVLLPELLGEAAPLNLICAHRAHLGETLRLLREHLSERCHVLLEPAPFLVR